MLVRPAKASRANPPRRGATAVEFAAICMPLFMFIVVSIELGRAMMVLEYMSNAARIACRYAVVNSPPTSSATVTNIQQQATNQLAIALVFKSTINVYYYTPVSPNYTPLSTLPPSTGWSSYPEIASTAPTSGNYVCVTVQVNVKDVSWLHMFLGQNQTMTVSEQMVVE